MDMLSWWNSAAPIITTVAFKVVGAIVLYLVGRWLIRLSIRLLSRVLAARHFDATLMRYVVSILDVGLNIVLLVAILGYFGVETTSFAALLAGVGLAVGAAWSGMLANFAAGAFLIMFRPYRVGDYVVAGGVEGTVVEIGLFNTTLLTPDSVTTIVGNAKVSGETIKNFSTNGFRRVDRTAQLAFGVDPLDAIARLKPALASIPNVVADPPPDVEILEFNAMGTVLAARPYCHTDHYWQVYFDTNRLIAATFGTAGYPVPYVVQAQRAGPPLKFADLKMDLGARELAAAGELPFRR
ncbi:MAG TPA: mechanosensitive ion channel family protein [Stellaceae bacterium]|nr:mechanosensitive ion channel family protein [Stellaceae bacterium]